LGKSSEAHHIQSAGPVIYPSGNIAADMQTIRAFYDGMTGKNPAQSMPPE
jgi:hypothetical protein